MSSRLKNLHVKIDYDVWQDARNAQIRGELRGSMAQLVEKGLLSLLEKVKTDKESANP
jgi:hypothetical protein